MCLANTRRIRRYNHHTRRRNRSNGVRPWPRRPRRQRPDPAQERRTKGRCTMVSPYTQPAAPLPPPPPTDRYRRSLAGPLILIVIGLVFLLRNIGVHIPVWHFFGRFWPLLIILWGVIALIEHFNALQHGYRKRGLGGGGC